MAALERSWYDNIWGGGIRIWYEEWLPWYAHHWRELNSQVNSFADGRRNPIAEKIIFKVDDENDEDDYIAMQEIIVIVMLNLATGSSQKDNHENYEDVYLAMPG